MLNYCLTSLVNALYIMLYVHYLFLSHYLYLPSSSSSFPWLSSSPLPPLGSLQTGKVDPQHPRMLDVKWLAITKELNTY
jgi:hypothetical protein